MVFVEDVLKSAQFFLLLRSVRLLVRGATSEGQCVVRVLGVLLVENVVFAVVPVREGSLVSRGLLDRLGWLNDLVDFLSCAFTLLPPKLRLVRR